MTMPDPWYEVVVADARLSQGDLILDCPILGWKSPGAAVEPGTLVDLASLSQVGLRDVVVMTQACDLEHNKVSNAVLCPAVPLSAFRRAWRTTPAGRTRLPPRCRGGGSAMTSRRDWCGARAS